MEKTTSHSLEQPKKECPLVSVMMASYDRAPLIGQAIESVMAQNYPNWELLVLDDASKDNTYDVVQDFMARDSRIKWLPAHHNLGINKNRNRGFERAIGEYIAILDSDDYWADPRKLEKQVGFLESHPDHALVGTGIMTVDGQDRKLGALEFALDDASIRRRMLMKNQFTHSSVLLRASALPLPSPYDESGFVSIWEDYELFLRLGLRHKFANLPEMTTAYRLHSGNITKARRLEGARAHLNIIRKYRHDYPYYSFAVLKGWFRLLRARLF